MIQTARKYHHRDKNEKSHSVLMFSSERDDNLATLPERYAARARRAVGGEWCSLQSRRRITLFAHSQSGWAASCCCYSSCNSSHTVALLAKRAATQQRTHARQYCANAAHCANGPCAGQHGRYGANPTTPASVGIARGSAVRAPQCTESTSVCWILPEILSGDAWRLMNVCRYMGGLTLPYMKGRMKIVYDLLAEMRMTHTHG